MEILVANKVMQVKTLLNEDVIKERTKQLAVQINADYQKDEPLVILIVLHGALLFAADLVRELDLPTLIETVRLRSYDGTSSTGRIELMTQIPPTVKNHHVLVVEDIIDSGRSLNYLVPLLKEQGAKSWRVVTMLDKPNSREVPFVPEYVGFEIGKNFVIGYGLDLDGRYRNLPYIAELVNK